LLRFTMESISTVRQFQRSSSTNPGKPPPLPRSRSVRGGVC
jgi:hypothetical protein